MQAIDRSSAEHYIWGNVCDGWVLVNRAELSVITERVPPGASESRHFHPTARQFFYILSGTAVMDLEGQAITLQAGQGLEVAPGQIHQFKNESDSDVNFLVISHPTTRGNRVEV